MDDDYGFSIVDENDISSPADYEKANRIAELIIPLLNNLAKNPEKDIIKWPGKSRVERIVNIKNEIDGILNE